MSTISKLGNINTLWQWERTGQQEAICHGRFHVFVLYFGGKEVILITEKLDDRDTQLIYVKEVLKVIGIVVLFIT